MKGFQEIITCDVESEKKKKNLESSSGDLDDLEEEKKKKLKMSKDEKEDDVEDVKMNNSSDDEEEKEKEKKANSDEKKYPILKYPVLNSSDEELTESEMIQYNEYYGQMVSSGGFDIDYCPPFFPCTLRPVRKLKDEEYLKLCAFSQQAINHFNLQNGTSYKFVKYVKAVRSFCAGEKFYITFEAKGDKEDVTTIFQALVYEGMPLRDGANFSRNVEVVLVRMKSSATEKDNPILLA